MMRPLTRLEQIFKSATRNKAFKVKPAVDLPNLIMSTYNGKPYFEYSVENDWDPVRHATVDFCIFQDRFTYKLPAQLKEEVLLGDEDGFALLKDHVYTVFSKDLWLEDKLKAKIRYSKKFEPVNDVTIADLVDLIKSDDFKETSLSVETVTFDKFTDRNVVSILKQETDSDEHKVVLETAMTDLLGNLLSNDNFELYEIKPDIQLSYLSAPGEDSLSFILAEIPNFTDPDVLTRQYRIVELNFKPDDSLEGYEDV